MPGVITTITKPLRLLLHSIQDVRDKTNNQTSAANHKPDSENGLSQVNIPQESKLHLPKESDSIAIAQPGHWHSRKLAWEQRKAAPHIYLEDGSEVKYERNEFGEAMPCLPPIARPKGTMRQITNGPGNYRWNIITASWTDSDRGSSRGTWGQFKDKRRLNRQMPDDFVDGSALFRGECLEETGIESARMEQEDMHFDRQQWRLKNQRNKSDVADICDESDANQLTFRELARLAAENESAIESYGSSVDDRVIRRFLN